MLWSWSRHQWNRRAS